jgi:hypothetical protein
LERDGKDFGVFCEAEGFFLGGGGEFGGQSIILRESVAFKLFEFFYGSKFIVKKKKEKKKFPRYEIVFLRLLLQNEMPVQYQTNSRNSNYK